MNNSKTKQHKAPHTAQKKNVPIVTPTKSNDQTKCSNVHMVPCKSPDTDASNGSSADPLILGPQWRLCNKQYTYVTIFLIGPPTTFYRAHFRDQKEWFHYHRQIMAIKSTMDDIIAGPENEQIKRLYDTWIPMVNFFVLTWGKEFVTKDIRTALNNVEKDLHLATTSFPDFLTLADLL